MIKMRELWRTASFRLTAIVTSSFLVAAIAIVGAIYWSTTGMLVRQSADDLGVHARVLASELAGLTPEAAANRISALSARAGRNYYLLMIPGGKIKAAGNLSRWPEEVGQPLPFASSDQGRPHGRLGLRAAADGIRVFTVDRETAPRLALGVGYRLPDGARLLIGRDLSEQQMLAWRIKWIVIAGSLFILLFGCLAGLVLSRLVMTRITKISQTGHRFMSGRFDERVPLLGTGDELDQLSQNLNEMFDRIEQLMAGLREVSDNIAHDLKTPLNRLRIKAEEALGDGRGLEASRAALENILADTDDIIRTFNALLQVARLEAGAIEQTVEVFDLGVLLGDIAELYEPVAEEAGGRLAVSVGTGVMMRGNRQLIGQAVTNLIENALKYGSAKDGRRAHVDIALSREPGNLVIAVADRGRGIAAEDRGHALKRFVRLDASRSRPGTGLGLSLVAAVARGHGGRVELLDNNPGLIARLVVPESRIEKAAETARRPRNECVQELS